MEDLKSLAWSLIPAAVGLAFGGGAGAAHGLTGGVADAGQNRLATDRLNADIQNRNAQIAMEQQRNNMAQERTDLDRQQMAMQAKRFEIDDKRAEQTMLFQNKQMERLDLEMNQARSSQAGQQAFRARLAPEQRDAFDVNPDKYLHEHYQREEEKTRLQGAGAILAGYGYKNGEDMARLFGPNGTAHFISAMEVAKRTPRAQGRDPFSGHQIDREAGVGHVWDARIQKWISQPLDTGPRGPKPPTPERRTQIEAGIRKEYDDLPDSEKLLTPYPKWRASPYGRLSEQNHSGAIDYNQSQAARQELSRLEAKDEDDARALMKKEYLAADPKRPWYMRPGAGYQTEAGFEEYVKTGPGQANLRQYKEALQERGWGKGIGKEPAPSPAPKPAAAPTPSPAPSAGPKRIKFDAQGNQVQ